MNGSGFTAAAGHSRIRTQTYRVGVWLTLLWLSLNGGCSPQSPQAQSGGGDASDDPPAAQQHVATMWPDQPAELTAVNGSTSVGADETVEAIRFRQLTAEELPHVVATNGIEKGYTTILESLGSGLAALDLDGDGCDDLVIAGGGEFGDRVALPKKIQVLRNTGTVFVSVPQETVLGETTLYQHGIAVSDLNSDGFPDFVLCGYGGAELYLNAGDGSFLPPRMLRACADLWCVSAACADFSNDGVADIFIATYVDWSFENDPPCYAEDGVTRDNCSPRLFNGQPDRLLIGDGSGEFQDAAAAWNVNTDSKALGVVAADLDLDGDIDLYVGNDVMTNYLYRNENGRQFEDLTVRSGAGVSSRGTPDASMGVDVCDFNGDGLPDIWSANFEHESFAIYRNQGDWLFRNVSELTGVASIPALYVGWGTAFQDFDLDGDADVVVTNGNVVRHPAHSAVRQRLLLLENQDSAWFEETGGDPQSPFSRPREGRGLAILDWNLDGRPDIALSPVNEPVEILENQADTDGSWLSIQLIGSKSARHPVGASVELHLQERVLTRQLKGGGSYASSSTTTLFFGIPSGESVQQLLVRWSDGEQLQIEQPPVNCSLLILEGRAQAYLLPR